MLCFCSTSAIIPLKIQYKNLWLFECISKIRFWRLDRLWHSNGFLFSGHRVSTWVYLIVNAARMTSAATGFRNIIYEREPVSQRRRWKDLPNPFFSWLFIDFIKLVHLMLLLFHTKWTAEEEDFSVGGDRPFSPCTNQDQGAGDIEPAVTMTTANRKASSQSQTSEESRRIPFYTGRLHEA